MDRKVIDNHNRYLERISLFKSYGYDVEKERIFIIEQAKPLRGKILEVGTGKGFFALALAKEGHPFVTIDISTDEQRFAKLNLSYFGFIKIAEFKIQNAEHTSFPDQSFDIIFSVNVMHHLQNPYRVIEEIIRILSPKGKIVLADFTEAGFKIMDKIHKLEGNVHDVSKVLLSDIELYLKQKGFMVTKTSSHIQDILIVKRRHCKKLIKSTF